MRHSLLRCERRWASIVPALIFNGVFFQSALRRADPPRVARLRCGDSPSDRVRLQTAQSPPARGCRGHQNSARWQRPADVYANPVTSHRQRLRYARIVEIMRTHDVRIARAELKDMPHLDAAANGKPPF